MSKVLCLNLLDAIPKAYRIQQDVQSAFIVKSWLMKFVEGRLDFAAGLSVLQGHVTLTSSRERSQTPFGVTRGLLAAWSVPHWASWTRSNRFLRRSPLIPLLLSRCAISSSFLRSMRFVDSSTKLNTHHVHHRS